VNILHDFRNFFKENFPKVNPLERSLPKVKYSLFHEEAKTVPVFPGPLKNFKIRFSEMCMI
jgi:hypothetical protein